MTQEKETRMPAKAPDQPAPKPSIAIQGNGLMPRNFEELYRVATIFASSGLMPKGLTRPEAVFVAIQAGMEMGLHPMQAVQNIAVINGRPSLWGDAMLGLVQSSGLLEDFQEFFEGKWGTDDFRAVCVAKRRGRSMPIRTEFSIADAKAAGLWDKKGREGQKTPWQTYPKRMLKMRARSWTLRDGFADVLKGMRAAEEVIDVDEMDAALPAPPPTEPVPAIPEDLPRYKNEAEGDDVSPPTIDDLMATAPKRTAKKRVAEFVKLSAEAANESEDALIARAMDANERFWQSFAKWNKPKKAEAKKEKAEVKPEAEPEPQEQAGEALASGDQLNQLYDLMVKKGVDEVFKMSAESILGALQALDGGDLTEATARKVMQGLVKKPMELSIIDKAIAAAAKAEKGGAA